VRPLSEEDVPPRRERSGVQRLVEGVGMGIGVHPDTAKVGAKGWLHLSAHAAVQRLPAAARPLDGLFHFRGNPRFAVSLSSQGQHPLHVAVPVVPLQSEQGLPDAG